MTKRIAALIFIFGCTTVAWMILGATIFSRTYSSDDKLKSNVGSTWGTPQEQSPPSATWMKVTENPVRYKEDGEWKTRVDRTELMMWEKPVSSRVNVNLNLAHRQKGLLWYSTYSVQFAGDYRFQNTTDKPLDFTFRLPFPAAKAIFDDLTLEVDGKPLNSSVVDNSAQVTARLAPGEIATFHAAYKSQGMDDWRYKLGNDVAQARDFVLNMHTNFHDIDFAANTLSPTEKRESPGGWDLAWRYSNLLSGFEIGMTMPEKLQPGPLAGEISYFAPVSLLFFFFLIFIVTTMRNIDLHPMNYFFLAAAFFSFHLLLAYLVDHVSIHLAFVICSLVSIFLVVSYLRLVIGPRFAFVEAGITQFVYLVLFSYAFFFKGLTGLAVTIGAIVTLFVVMQLTAHIRWADKFQPRLLPEAR